MTAAPPPSSPRAGLGRVFGPQPSVSGAQRGEHSQVVRTSTPVMLFFGVVLVAQATPEARDVYGIATSIVLVAVVLGRTRWVAASGLTASLACCTVPWLGFASEAPTTSATAELMWLVIGVGVALLSLPARWFAGVAAVNLVVTAVLLAGNAGIPTSAAVEVVVYLTFVNALALVVAVLRDRGARRLDREIRFSTDTLESMPDPLFVADHDGAIAIVNGAFARLVGADGGPDTLRGQPVARFVEGWDSVAAQSAPPHLGAADVQLQPVTGDRIPLALHTMHLPRSAATGRAGGIIGVGRDMRETHQLLAAAAKAEAHRAKAAELRTAHEQLVETQAQLVQAGKLAALGELAAAVAHEINNPLTGVTLAASLLDGQLKNGVPDAERAAIYLGQVREGTERCRKIVNGLLRFGRSDPSERSPVELGGVVDAALGLVGHKLHLQGAKLSLEAPEPVFVLGSEGQLVQVVMNLLLNAGDALAGPGRVDVSVLRVGGRARVEVSDDGPGVDAAIHARIFEPFFTTKEVGEGTGLGLSVSYGIVAEHGGSLELVEKEAGRGATFRVELDVMSAEDRGAG